MIFQDKKQYSGEKVSIRVIAILPLLTFFVLPFWAKGQGVDSLLMQAKLLTVSAYRQLPKDSLLALLQQQPAEIYKAKKLKGFYLIKISSKQAVDSYNSCVFYLVYEERRRQFYRIAGFDQQEYSAFRRRVRVRRLFWGEKAIRRDFSGHFPRKQSRRVICAEEMEKEIKVY